MTKYVNKDDWVPSDNLSLEDNALKTVISDYNTLIVAGPGAGKTELLAQRASYLLQTNTCSYPKKILAISFKRDAAYNLKNRIDSRCGIDLSKRFDSFTFDAFSKLLLDQFYRGLPAEYRINFPYEVVLSENEILNSYKAIDIDYFNSTGKEDILSLHNRVLPVEISDDEDKLRLKVWKELLNRKNSVLSFKMIMRLSQFIIQCNPRIQEYLQKSYSYIFLDEFQDTTFLQYEFLNTCFFNSNSILSAVGDDKQRIMLWAGARPDIFESYIKEYKAVELPLVMNFRSAPQLVKLQNHLILKLLNKDLVIKPSDKWDENAGEALVYLYDDQQKETEHLFEEVKKWIEEQSLSPRDICILVKQQLGVYASTIIEYFNANGIRARDENQLQDLLSDDLMIFILNSISLMFNKNEYDKKTQAIEFLINLFPIFDDKDIIKLENRYHKLLKSIKKDDIVIKKLVEGLIDFIGTDKISAHIPIYKSRDFLKENTVKLSEELEKYNNSATLYEAVEQLLGKDSIPIMTIHKSKGLEYNTIVFVGLEDGAFWSFEKQPDEDKCAFFVALSRAVERVVFTFSKKRKDRYGNVRIQATEKIKVIIDELRDSNIVQFNEISS